MKRKLSGKKAQRSRPMFRRLWFWFGLVAALAVLINWLNHRREPVTSS